MVPHVCKPRQSPSASKPFDALVKYIEEKNEKEPPQRVSDLFAEMIDYAINPTEELSGSDKCVAIRTNLIRDIKTASMEMNAVASNNARVESPAYHIVLSWPEHERPSYETIFDAAEHSLKALGLGQHQYVVAIHANTDNLHAHIAVNRVDPFTFKSKNIEWAHKTLHLAARQSELKHGWSHDNGLYVVQLDEHGKKSIVFNTEHSHEQEVGIPHAHGDEIVKEPRWSGKDTSVATWHDPESLESWLKKNVSRDLKKDFPHIKNWQGLHAWLSNYDIKLSDSGGGGLRLRAMSPETGEEFDIAASKGLRLLKRSDLEKVWGKFAKPYQFDVVVPDFSSINPIDLHEGIEHVLRNTLDGGSPPNHILHPEYYPGRTETAGGGSLHELPFGSLDVSRYNGGVLLPYPLQKHMGDREAGDDQDLRRAGPIEKIGRSAGSVERIANPRGTRDSSKREVRKAERAAARADLRLRFSQYKKFVALGDSGEDGYFVKMKEIRAQRSAGLRVIRDRGQAGKLDVRKTVPHGPERMRRVVEIESIVTRQTLQIESDFKAKYQALQATRQPPLSWREWLFEQSKLGDQAALSGLRGIVYQAQREAAALAKDADQDELESEEENASDTPEVQFEKAMNRLLDEEKKELAIRSAQRNMMRPYEADALLRRYAGIQWDITGNGNVKYSDMAGKHLFTDRGNRLTFDRVFVADDEIKLALIHAQQKFGKQLTLTGDDPVFVHRMARLADELGITVLNPELQNVITQHRIDRSLEIAASRRTQAAVADPETGPEATPVEGTKVVSNRRKKRLVEPLLPSKETGLEKLASDSAEPMLSDQDRLRAMVLAIDPTAKFVEPDPSNDKLVYQGVLAASLEDGSAFAQHIGRGTYALHAGAVPAVKGSAALEVKYVDRELVAKPSALRKGKGTGRGE